MVICFSICINAQKEQIKLAVLFEVGAKKEISGMTIKNHKIYIREQKNHKLDVYDSIFKLIPDAEINLRSNFNNLDSIKDKKP